MTGKQFQRTGAVALVIGPILIVAGLAPRPFFSGEVLETPEVTLQKIADSALWVPGELLAVAGFLIVLGGLGALSRSITGDSATILGNIGFSLALISTSMVVTLIGLDAVGLKGVGDLWAETPPADREPIMRAAQTVDAITTGVFGLWIAMFFGLTTAVYGLTIVASDSYPTWLGWLQAVLGSVGVVAGVAYAVTLSSGGPAFIAVPLVLLWLVIIGILLWRRAGTGA